MKQNFELRNEALCLLKGNWGNVILLSLMINLLVGLCGLLLSFLIPVAGGILSNIFILFPFTYVFILKLLTFSRDKNGAEITSRVIDTVIENYKKSILIYLLTSVYIFLWFLLLIIPGIVKSYSYALATYIRMDNEELSTEECINKSMELMKGKKMKLFLLDLSFIGWYLLAMFFTLGIGLLWVTPYHQMARIAFYENLKAEEVVVEQPQVVEE